MENQIPMTSASIGKITEALSTFQGSIVQPKLNKSVIVTTKQNGSYKFKYADLAACIGAAAPELQKNGLAVIQTIQGNMLVTTLSHKSGEFINSFLPLNPATMQSTSFQSIGSMITYLKRYAYCAILGIVADEDDDANAACGNQVQYNQVAKPQQSQAAPANTRAGITGAQLKGYITDINSKTNIDDVLAAASAVPEAVKNTEQFQSAVFQKASMLAIGELKVCNTVDEVTMLVERWSNIWKKVVDENTPFANAVANKYNTLKA